MLSNYTYMFKVQCFGAHLSLCQKNIKIMSYTNAILETYR